MFKWTLFWILYFLTPKVELFYWKKSLQNDLKDKEKLLFRIEFSFPMDSDRTVFAFQEFCIYINTCLGNYLLGIFNFLMSHQFLSRIRRLLNLLSIGHSLVDVVFSSFSLFPPQPVSLIFDVLLKGGWCKCRVCEWFSLLHFWFWSANFKVSLVCMVCSCYL